MARFSIDTRVEHDCDGMVKLKRLEFGALLVILGCKGGDPTYEPPEVYVNEFVASNASGLTDESGAFPDWIELWNGGDELIDLSTYTLTDDATQPQKWSFPAGSELEADGYMIVFADGDPSTETELHASFKLSADGEAIQLIGPASEDFPVVDYVSYDVQTTDVSWARMPNGGDWGADETPTPGAANE